MKRIALVGNPNCGKTALFNRLTGAKQKVANYAGVTVERKSGVVRLPTGERIEVIDLPGTYSLVPGSSDEEVTVSVLRGTYAHEPALDGIVLVLDATHLLRGLRLLLAVQRLGIPMVVALNLMDVARKNGQAVEAQDLANVLEMPVAPTVATRPHGADDLLALLALPGLWVQPVADDTARAPSSSSAAALSHAASAAPAGGADWPQDHQHAAAMMQRLGLDLMQPAASNKRSSRMDRIFLHPVWGALLLAMVLFVMFQAVFGLAEIPMGWLEQGTQWVADQVANALPQGMLRSLLVDGVIAGVGGVLVFLPQILILFFFILLFEESGYLPRAALLMDRLMGKVGLSGRAFIPLLSSFACAIPGILATRTIPDTKSRLITVFVAPLMTCSARLPVYTLLIGAFVPPRKLWGFVDWQGLTLFGLYVLGMVAAASVAWVFKALFRFTSNEVLVMELPDYRLPYWRSVALGLWHRVLIFLKRMGTTIVVLSVALWFVCNFPKAPKDAPGSAIAYSIAGRVGRAIEPVFRPLGFDWQISVSLIPSMAAREVMVSSLSTIYAVQEDPKAQALPEAAVVDGGASSVPDEDALGQVLQQQWSLATALAVLAWFVFAPMCLPTLVTVRNELNSRKAAGWMAAYQFALAYAAAFLVYRLVLWLGG